MLSQVSQNIIFHAFFTKSKVGVAPSAAPTVSIERKESGTLVVSGGTTTAGLLTGHYTYTLAAASDATADDYLAVFHTTDTTVDFQDVPSLWCVGNSLTQLEVNGNAPGTNGGLGVLDSNGDLPANLVSVNGVAFAGFPANFEVMAINSSGGTVYVAGDTAGNPLATAAALSTVGTNVTNNGTSLTTLLSRLTAARAGYLDNLNVGGPVASHADIAALNQSASRTMTLACVAQMEPGETYTIEMHCYNRGTGASSNADSTPTLTATGAVSGSLSGNLTGPTNPTTAVYQWTYTVPASPTLEQIRFAGSATVAGFSDSLACYSQTVDEATVVFTSTNQAHLEAIYNKLPSGNIGDATDAHVLALGSPMQANAAVVLAASQPNYAPAKAGDAMTLTAPTVASIQSGLATSSLQNTINTNVLALPSAATIAASVRDVDNRTPAANSLGAGVNAAAQGSGGGGGGGVTRPVTVIERNTIVNG